MLCPTCQTFLTNILQQDFLTWRRPQPENPKWVTFKIGNYHSIAATAEAGCDLCQLFNRVRNLKIANYGTLGEKWHAQPASIDYGVEPDLEDEENSRWTFYLLTVGPEMSWIPFEVFRPDMAGRAIEGIVDNELDLPFAVAGRPTSADTLHIIKSWIDIFSPRLTRCEGSSLPRRVIDVGKADGSECPLLLADTSFRGVYLTLSHCWGTSERLTLTTENLESFQKSIPCELLPKTFQDAIKFTRLLGLRYIWIDALCIIQDDEDDWRREAAKMCDVYRNAYFTISALAAEDSHTGFLHDRSSQQIEAVIDGETFGIRRKLDSLTTARKNAKIESRAWCFQESLLSRAILYVGPEQVYWQSGSSTASEARPKILCGPQDTVVETLMNSDSSTVLNKSSDSSTGINRQWLDIVREYSKRNVTRASDRLPAIDGLAQQAGEEHASMGSYTQGLWSNCLHADLLWQRQHVIHTRLIPSRDKYPTRISTVSSERPKEAIAGSWSWASVNSAVYYPLFDAYSFRSPSRLDADFDELPESSGWLSLKSLVKRGTCRLLQSPTVESGNALFNPSGSARSDEGLICYLDYPDEPVPKVCYCLRIANWSKNARTVSRGRDCSLTTAAYLLVERLGNDDTNETVKGQVLDIFRRIGVGYDQVDKVNKIFVNVQHRSLDLI